MLFIVHTCLSENKNVFQKLNPKWDECVQSSRKLAAASSFYRIKMNWLRTPSEHSTASNNLNSKFERENYYIVNFDEWL